MNGRTNSSDVTIQEINYGALIPLEAPTNLVLTPLNARVDITWTDPVDKVAFPGGEDVALWDRTVIIRKAGSAPTGPDDGEIIYTETTRNQHQYDVYSDTNNVVNNTVYYYAVYAYTQMDVPSEPISGNCKPLAGVPEYYGPIPTGLNRDDAPDASGVFVGNVIYVGSESSEALWKYDSSLTLGTIQDAIGYGRAANTNIGCANTLNHLVLAGGGEAFSSSYGQPNADALDSSFTRTPLEKLNDNGSTTNFGAIYRNDITSVSFKGNALFAGPIESVDRYDSSLTHSLLADLMRRKSQMGSIAFGDYAIFAGGSSSTALSDVELYNSSFVKSSAANLSIACSYPASTIIGAHIIFIGNNDNSMFADSYNSSLTKFLLDPIVDNTSGYDRNNGAQGISTGGYAMFLYRYGGMLECLGGVLYDPSLTRISMQIDDEIKYKTPKAYSNIHLEKNNNLIFMMCYDSSIYLFSIN